MLVTEQLETGQGHPQEALEGDKRAEGKTSVQHAAERQTQHSMAAGPSRCTVQSHLPHIQGGHGHGAVRPFQPAG